MKKIYKHVLKLKNKKYYFIYIIMIFFIVINNAFFQTKIAKHILFKINKNYHTNILLDNFNINLLIGNIKIQNFKILDKKKNILISIPKIEGKINIWNLFFNKFNIQNLSVHNPKINIITYKNDYISNLIYFIQCFQFHHFTQNNNNFSINNLHIKKAYIHIINNNKYIQLILKSHFNYFSKEISFSNKLIRSSISNIMLKGKYLNKNIYINFHIKNLLFTNNKLMIFNSHLIFNDSKILNCFSFSYKTYTDLFHSFQNVFFSLIIKKGSYISSNDINFFIKNNLLLTKSIFYLTCQIHGVLKKNINILNFDLRIGKNIIKSKHIFLYKKKNTFCLFFQKNTFIKTSLFDIKQILSVVVLNKIPVIFNRYGNLKYYGSININSYCVQLHGKLISSTIGIISGKILFFNFKKLKNIEYQGKLYINLKNIYPLNNNNSKYIKGELFFYGKGYQLNNSNIQIHGIIKNLFISNQQIHNININGYFMNNYLYGLVDINDNHHNMKINFHGKMKIYQNKYLIYGKLNLNNYLIYGKNINLRLHWTTSKSLNVHLYLNKIFYKSSQKILFIPNINFIYRSFKQKKQFCILSIPEVIKLSFFGKFQWIELSRLLKNNINKLFNNQEYHSVASNQYIDFKIYITEKFINLFNNTINHLSACEIIGNLSDKDLIIYGKSKMINFNACFIKNLNFILNTNKKYNIILNIHTISSQKITIKNINLYTFINNNIFFLKINFYLIMYNFYQEVNLNFFKRNYYLNGIKYMFIGLSRSLIKMNNNNWWLNKENEMNYNQLTIDLKDQKFLIHELDSNKLNQKINFSSKILNNNYNLIQGILKQIKDFTINHNIFKNLFLIEKYNSKFIFEIKLQIYLNNTYIGNIKMHIIYNHQKYKILLKIKNTKKSILYISGYIKNFFNRKEYINLKVKIYHFPVIFLKQFIKNTFSNFRGRCTGILDLTGDYHHINYNGYLYINNIGVKINNINTDYEIIGRPLILFKKKTIFFNNLIIRDTKYNSIGYLNGIIIHEYNKWIISVYIDSKNLLILDTNEINNKLIYGTIFAKSKIHILGDIDNLSINITNGKISHNSKLFISTENNESNHLIFNKKLKFQNHDSFKKESKKFLFNIESNIDEKCKIKLFFNSKKNNFLQARGIGNILFKTNSLGVIEMSGIYYINNGYYQLNSKNLPQLNKKFQIRRGGTITWLSLPNNPKLNITTFYPKSVNNIEEYIKIPNSLLLKNINSELIIKISGNLVQPKFQFDIDFTGINNNLKQQIIQKIYNRDERITQFGSILVLGKFLIKNQLLKTYFISFSNNILKSIINILMNNKIDDHNIDHPNIMKNITYSLIYDINKYFSIKGMMICPIINQNKESLKEQVKINIDVNKKLDKSLKLILLYHSLNAYRENIFFSKIYGGYIFYTISFDDIKDLSKIFLLYK